MDSQIAIIGMSCRFAGVSTPAALWNAIMQRKVMLAAPDAEVELPLGQKNLFNRPYPAKIGQLGRLYSCISSMHNFPRQVNAGENQDLYFATQLAFDALMDASIKPHSRDQIRGSVHIGYAPPFNASTMNWLQHTMFLDQTLEVIRRFFPMAPEDALDSVKTKLVESLPAPDASSFLIGAGYRFASWIARECSFAGAATIMDAGMLTGAATLMDAIDGLNSGRVDVALIGSLTPPLNRAYIEGLSGVVQFCSGQELMPFAKDQDGTMPGEGGAFFVLKRRSDALRDRDRIYAVVRSVAIGHNPEDDPSCILAEAIRRANVPIRTIGLIEANGTGIREEEDREIAAIQKLWGEHRPGSPLVGIGSIKGNIGHTLRASISAGMVKAIMALHRKVLPPQVSVDHPLDAIANLSSSAYLLTEERPWITGNSASIRRAVVLGANFDATNPIGAAVTSGRAAAIVLEEEPEDRT